jgi:purine-binding chemotaxis protein CheW
MKDVKEPQMNENGGDSIRNLVTFRLDRQTYALPIEPIVQIIEMVTITPIPQVNHSVEGVINVRGAAVPVINLRRHLGLPEAKLQLHTPIILVQTGERMVGLIVDQVSDVLNVNAGQITCPSDLLPDGLSDAPLLRGLIQSPAGAVLLLDLEHLWASNPAQLAQTLEALSAVEASWEHDQPEPVEAAGADELDDLSKDDKKELAETASADEPGEVEV